MTRIKTREFFIAAFTILFLMMSGTVGGEEKTTGENGEAYKPTKTLLMVEKGSKIEKELLDMLGAKEGEDLQFKGRIRCFGRWASFGGDALQKSGESLNDGDVAALWFYTTYGWVLVDALMDITDAGHFDYWIQEFGAPRKLFYQ